MLKKVFEKLDMEFQVPFNATPVPAELHKSSCAPDWFTFISEGTSNF